MKMTEVLGGRSIPSYPGCEVRKSFFKASYGIKPQHRDGREKGRSANNRMLGKIRLTAEGRDEKGLLD